jgi:hypothetical protein
MVASLVKVTVSGLFALPDAATTSGVVSEWLDPDDPVAPVQTTRLAFELALHPATGVANPLSLYPAA